MTHAKPAAKLYISQVAGLRHFDEKVILMSLRISILGFSVFAACAGLLFAGCKGQEAAQPPVIPAQQKIQNNPNLPAAVEDIRQRQIQASSGPPQRPVSQPAPSTSR